MNTLMMPCSYNNTEVPKVRQDLLWWTVVNHLALGEESKGREEGEDGVARLVDGQNDDPCLT